MESVEKNNNNTDNAIKISKNKILAAVVLVIFISAFSGAVFGLFSGEVSRMIYPKLSRKFGKYFPQKDESGAKIDIQKQNIIQEDSAVIDVAEKSSAAVVSIIITKDVPKIKNSFQNPFGFEFFSNPYDWQKEPETEKQQVGGGSGFFVDSSGIMVTNKHVVEDVQAEYTVMTNDGKEYPAQVLVRHPVLDIAIIKVEGNNFPVLDLGDSDNLKVGQTVIAIGNSLGEFSNTVSKGIVSGLRRNVTAGSDFGQTERLTNIIQTDAAINPGNSGGPLFDINGKVIGINVAMAMGAENIGFAIPINQIKSSLDQIKTKGKFSVPFIGVRYIAINKEIQKNANLSFDYGALVVRGQKITDFAVIPGSPADKAGITENDIILEINGKKVTEDNPLSDIIALYNVGDELTLKVWHKGEIKDMKVKMEEKK